MFITLSFFAGLCALATAYVDPSTLCNELLSLDCKSNYIPGERDETVCGTNGKTYSNFCFYSQDRCNDKTLTISTVGACSGGSVTATMPVMTTVAGTTGAPQSTAPTTPGTTTADPIMAAFCQNKNSIQCGTDLSPICGSDKQFYLNQCEYSKAYCDNKSLTSKDISFCTGGR